MRLVLAAFVFVFVAIAVAKPSFRSRVSGRGLFQRSRLRSTHLQKHVARQGSANTKESYRELKFLLGNLLKSSKGLKRTESSEDSDPSFSSYCLGVSYDSCVSITDDDEFFGCIDENEEEIGNFFLNVYQEAKGKDLLTQEMHDEMDQASESSCSIQEFILIQEVIDEAFDKFYDDLEDTDLSEETWGAVYDNTCRFYMNREDAFDRLVSFSCGDVKK